MKFQELKVLIEQGKLLQFQEKIKEGELDVKTDYSLLLREIIKNKSQNIKNIFEKLVKKGADVNFINNGGNQQSNLMIACQGGTLESVKLLIYHPKIDLNLEDTRKRTAPFYAIQNKNKNDGEIFLRIILQCAPNLVNKPANNQTMLIIAIRKQRPEFVKILLSHKAQPNYIIADSGNTALHEALKILKNKQTKAIKEILKLLIEYGADPQIKNKTKNMNAFQFAEKFPLEAFISEISVRSRDKVLKKDQDFRSSLQQTKQAQTLGKKQSLNKKYDRSQSQPIKQISQKELNKNKLSKNKQQIRYQKQKAQSNKKKKILFSIKNDQDVRNIMNRADCVFKLQMNKMQQQEIKGPSKNYQNLLSEDQSSSDSKDSESQNEKNQSNLPYQKKQQFVASLSEQIQRFTYTCDNSFRIAQDYFARFYTVLCEISNRENMNVQIYGSFSTGLWYKNCDVDVVLCPRDQSQSEKIQNYNEHILNRIEDLLRKNQSISIINSIKAKKTRIPVVRVQIQFPCNKEKTKKIDITIWDRNHNGLAISHYINDNIQMTPQLKPLFFVIKALTYHFKLNDLKAGGIKTYAIIIMILSFLQNLKIKGVLIDQTQLGELLLRFLYFFGFQYQYTYRVVSDQKCEQKKGQMSLALQIFDPLNHLNNLGKTVNAYQLQSMFRTAFIGLHCNINQEKLEFIFGLKKIYSA